MNLKNTFYSYRQAIGIRIKRIDLDMTLLGIICSYFGRGLDNHICVIFQNKIYWYTDGKLFLCSGLAAGDCHPTEKMGVPLKLEENPINSKRLLDVLEYLIDQGKEITKIEFEDGSGNNFNIREVGKTRDTFIRVVKK